MRVVVMLLIAASSVSSEMRFSFAARVRSKLREFGDEVKFLRAKHAQTNNNSHIESSTRPILMPRAYDMGRSDVCGLLTEKSTHFSSGRTRVWFGDGRSFTPRWHEPRWPAWEHAKQRAAPHVAVAFLERYVRRVEVGLQW